MTEMLTELRRAIRLAIKTPAVTVAIVISLSLGIGLNVMVFTFVNAILFPPLDTADPSRLVALYTRDEQTPGYLQSSYLNYQDYAESHAAFDQLFAQVNVPLLLGDTSGGERALGKLVTANYFTALGVTPALGRGFAPADDRAGQAQPVTVVSAAFGRRRFGSAAQAIGATVIANGERLTVIGVAPATFTGTEVGFAPDLWIPMGMQPRVAPALATWMTERRALAFDVIGRLKPGVTLAGAQAALTTEARRLAQLYPGPNGGRSAALVPIARARINPNARGPFVLVAGFLGVVVALVLVIACVNIANLLLARASSRRVDMGVRAALGATRMALMRQVVAESLVVAAGAGVFGLALGYVLAQRLWALRPETTIPLSVNLQPDLRVLIMTVLLTVITAIAVSAVPALRAIGAEPRTALTETPAGGASSHRGVRMRSGLVVTQITLSFVLLVVSGLFVRSLRQAETIDPGFATSDVVVASLDATLHGYTMPDAGRAYARLQDALAQTPGVRGAAVAQNAPLSGGTLRTVLIDSVGDQSTGRGPMIMTNIISPDYLRTLGIALRQGRDFSPQDRDNAPLVAIVNDAMAKRFWPGQDVVGRRFRFWGDPTPREIVGVAATVKYNSIGEDPRPFVYLPLAQNPVAGVALHIRLGTPAAAAVRSMRTDLARLAPDLPVLDVFPLTTSIERSLWLAQTGAMLLGAFGVLSLVLAVVGLYGVMAYAASQRTRELGIRMALGADGVAIRGLLLHHGVRLTLIGLTVGVAIAALAVRALMSLLYGVRAFDLTTFAVAALVLAAAALLASYLPARRASRLDPLHALRHT